MKYIPLKELVVGTWYYSAVLDYFFKFLKLETTNTNCVYSTRHTNKGENKDYLDYFCHSKMEKTIELADMDKVKEFYPDEFPEIINTYEIF